MKTIDDNELIRQFNIPETKEQAFNLLVKKHKKFLYWHIRKIVIRHDDTDDVLQNTFIKVWNSLSNFKKRSKLSTWLYRIATNEALTYLKSKKRRLSQADDIINVEELLITNLKSDPYFDGDLVQLKLHEAIIKLPDKQRLVFNMRYFDDLPYSQISEILNTSVGALKASYHHAANKIKKSLNTQEID